ncbi:MAG: DUF2089 family protein [Pirellulales bacterium]|jgi:hypothetical protein
MTSQAGPEPQQHPLLSLGDEDLEFVLRMVLASGSLKDLAAQYGVSYPTIRARLDRVIERLRAAVEGRTPDPMANLLADLVERQELAPATARKVLALHRKTLAGKENI